MMECLEQPGGAKTTREEVHRTVQQILGMVKSHSQKDRDLFLKLFGVMVTTADPEEREDALETMIEILFDDGKTTKVSVFEMTLPKPDSGPSEGATTLVRWMGHVASRIRKLREEKGWTQDDLANRSGLSQSHVSRIEGGVHSPSNKTLTKIAHALGVSPGDIDPAV